MLDSETSAVSSIKLMTDHAHDYHHLYVSLAIDHQLPSGTLAMEHPPVVDDFQAEFLYKCGDVPASEPFKTDAHE